MRPFAALTGALLLTIVFGATDLKATTFAQFTEANGTDDFLFTNNGSGLASFTATSQIYFTFFTSGIPAADLLMGPLPTGPIFATLTRTGTTSKTATTSGSQVTQVLDTSSVTITANGHTLLHSSGSSASLVGTLAGLTLSLSNSSPPNTLSFSSDYIDFSSATTTSRTTSFDLANALSVGNDGLLNSFAASGSGGFGVTFASTPEPGSVSLAILGFAFAGFTKLRSRRRI